MHRHFQHTLLAVFESMEVALQARTARLTFKQNLFAQSHLYTQLQHMMLGSTPAHSSGTAIKEGKVIQHNASATTKYSLAANTLKNPVAYTSQLS